MQFVHKKFNLIILILFVLTFVSVVLKPVEIFPDTLGYTDMYIIRSPAYPIFVNAIKLLSGAYFDTIFIVIQLLMGLSAIWFFVMQLRKHLNIHSFWMLCITVVLLVPYFHTDHVANRILSEGLAYPLYLIVTSYFISLFITSKKESLYKALPFLFLLILTRYQFIYMIPVGILILVWISFKEKSFKANKWLFLILVLFPLFTSLTDKTYHYFKHGHFVSTPWTGIHFLAPIMYVADDGDENTLETEFEKTYFKKVYAELARKKLNTNHLNISAHETPTSFYINHYSDIANGTILAVGENLVDQNLTINEKYIQVDEITKKMTTPLLLNNSVEWTKVYIRNMINGFGNLKYTAIHFLLLFYGLFCLLKKNQLQFQIITLIMLLTVSNIVLISIGMHAVKRFTFYNDWTLYLAIFILLNSFSKRVVK